jgi:5-methylthioadenosine/S-adenosylhomocysteine deaminase
MRATMKAPADLLLLPQWVVPVEPEGTLADHAVVVQDGRILDVLPADAAQARYAGRQTLALPGHALIPGLVNLHGHAAMSLLRGYADDQPLMAWLRDRIWPAEKQHVSEAFVRDGTLLAAAEMLSGGITACNDMYFFPQAAGEAFLQAGMRATLGMIVMEFASPYAVDADDYLAKGLAMRDELKEEPLLSFAFAPHAPYTIADATFGRINSARPSTPTSTKPPTKSRTASGNTACARWNGWRGWACWAPTSSASTRCTSTRPRSNRWPNTAATSRTARVRT